MDFWNIDSKANLNANAKIQTNALVCTHESPCTYHCHTLHKLTHTNTRAQTHTEIQMGRPFLGGGGVKSSYWIWCVPRAVIVNVDRTRQLVPDRDSPSSHGLGPMQPPFESHIITPVYPSGDWGYGQRNSLRLMSLDNPVLYIYIQHPSHLEHNCLLWWGLQCSPGWETFPEQLTWGHPVAYMSLYSRMISH